jgi:hypothetical protein
MGTWGTGALDNDDAMDQVRDFEQAPSEPLLHQALETVAGAEDYLERDPGSLHACGCRSPHLRKREVMSGHAAKMREEAETQNWRRFRLDEVSLAIERKIAALHCDVLLSRERDRIVIGTPQPNSCG